MKVFITAANGMFGKALANQLCKMGISVRGLVRDPSKFPDKHHLIELVTGNLDHPETLAKQMEGVTKVFLATPMDPLLDKREIAIVDIAKSAGVKHIVKIYGAVRHDGDLLNYRHLNVIEHLKSSGLEWTLVSPNSVMETSLLPLAESIRSENIIYGMSGEGKIGFVSLKDISLFTAHIFSTNGHHGHNYEITGPEALSLYDVAEIMSKTLNRRITYKDFKETDFHKMIKDYSQLPDEIIEIEILCHLRAWKNGNANLVTDTFFQLLKQPATNLHTFIQRHINEFKS